MLEEHPLHVFARFERKKREGGRNKRRACIRLERPSPTYRRKSLRDKNPSSLEKKKGKRRKKEKRGKKEACSFPSAALNEHFYRCKRGRKKWGGSRIVISCPPPPQGRRGKRGKKKRGEYLYLTATRRRSSREKKGRSSVFKFPRRKEEGGEEDIEGIVNR